VTRLVYSAITSLDLYHEDADGRFDWSAPDEEVHAFVNDLERPVRTHLYGRRMYDVLKVWEDMQDPAPVMRDFAEIWRAADKIVYSRTLQEPSTPKTRIEREFVPDAVRALKARGLLEVAIAAQPVHAGERIGTQRVECLPRTFRNAFTRRACENGVRVRQFLDGGVKVVERALRPRVDDRRRPARNDERARGAERIGDGTDLGEIRDLTRTGHIRERRENCALEHGTQQHGRRELSIGGDFQGFVNWEAAFDSMLVREDQREPRHFLHLRSEAGGANRFRACVQRGAHLFRLRRRGAEKA